MGVFGAMPVSAKLRVMLRADTPCPNSTVLASVYSIDSHRITRVFLNRLAIESLLPVILNCRL